MGLMDLNAHPVPCAGPSWLLMPVHTGRLPLGAHLPPKVCGDLLSATMMSADQRTEGTILLVDKVPAVAERREAMMPPDAWDAMPMMVTASERDER